tara:strand:- start:556 stop:780 length:225 start_codon:yes stop_codon:yes gene_type:complete
MNDPNLIYAKAMINGRCVDLLLEQEDLIRGFENMLEHPKEVPIEGQCWSIDKPDKCGILDRLMNKCCECGDERQ